MNEDEIPPLIAPKTENPKNPEISSIDEIDLPTLIAPQTSDQNAEEPSATDNQNKGNTDEHVDTNKSQTADDKST